MSVCFGVIVRTRINQRCVCVSSGVLVRSAPCDPGVCVLSPSCRSASCAGFSDGAVPRRLCGQKPLQRCVSCDVPPPPASHRLLLAPFPWFWALPLPGGAVQDRAAFSDSMFTLPLRRTKVWIQVCVNRTQARAGHTRCHRRKQPRSRCM